MWQCAGAFINRDNNNKKEQNGTERRRVKKNEQQHGWFMDFWFDQSDCQSHILVRRPQTIVCRKSFIVRFYDFNFKLMCSHQRRTDALVPRTPIVHPRKIQHQWHHMTDMQSIMPAWCRYTSVCRCQAWMLWQTKHIPLSFLSHSCEMRFTESVSAPRLATFNLLVLFVNCSRVVMLWFLFIVYEHT